MKNNKKLKGQFYTTVNPFHNQLFLKWFNEIEDIKTKTILEPFAGSNNIVKMIQEFYNNKWKCFDIEPNNYLNNAPEYNIQKNDSLKNFPLGFDIAITNPPYLAKNSATRDGLPFPDTQFDDLYKYSLSIMLDNVRYLAAIIPESFITQGLFHERLYGIATLNCRMFDDTECPVCLALFVPEIDKINLLIKNDFYYYKGNINLGLFSEMEAKKRIYEDAQTSINWKFNNPDGEIGLYAIDSTSNQSIRFVDGNDIPENKIKISSRGITRISGIPKNLDSKDLIKEANSVLMEFRYNTQDIFMTSFRGLRKDGDYRRRLDFSLAKIILNYSVNRLGGYYA